MKRQQAVLSTFRTHFEKLKKEKILIYGRGLYARLILENFREYPFVGIIDRLDLEGSYCGLPVLKYEEVLQSGAKNIIIAASLENTELIRKRIGNFCIRNRIRLFSADGRCLDIDDCVYQVSKHPAHSLNREQLKKEAGKSKTIFVELSVLFMRKGCRSDVRAELLEDLYWMVQHQKQVVLFIPSFDDERYKIFQAMNIDFELCLSVQETKLCGIYHKLMQITKHYDAPNYLYIGSDGVLIAESLGIRVYRIYAPMEMLAHSTFQMLCHQDSARLEKIYTELIACRLYGSPYALNGTGGKVHLKKAYDMGYIFLGPLVMDFMIWYIQKIREYKIEQVIFSARDGYLFQKLYNSIRKRAGQSDLPDSIYLHTSRIVCNLANIYCADDIRKQTGEYFKGNLQEMMQERFMLDADAIAGHARENYESDTSYFMSFEKDILGKAAEMRKNYERYMDRMPLKENKKTAFFDLFASGTCQLALEKMTCRTCKGLYFSKYWTADEEKQKLDIDGFLEFDPFMGDHSMLLESILSSPQPTLRDIDENGVLRFGNETRSEAELNYMQEAQSGVIDFVEEVLQCFDRLPEKGTGGYGIQVFQKIISKYSEIENQILKNMVIWDEILHRNQYLGDFYKY